MALDTYAGLKVSIASFLRNRSDITAQIPDFVRLAEAQMNRKLRARRMVASVPFTIDAEFVALPADFMTVSTFYLPGTPLRELEACQPDMIAAWKAASSGLTGKPRHYAVVGDQFQFYRAPADTYTAQLTYRKRITPLVMDADANWVLQNHPDAYLYGSLLQSAPWLGADDRLQTWAAIFTAVVGDINDSSKSESLGTHLSARPRHTP